MIKSIIALSIFCLLSAAPVSAKNGLTTSNTNDEGQVQVTNEDGVMYLTTQTIVNPDAVATASSTSAITNTYSSFYNPLHNFVLELPEGFATDFGGLLNGVLSFVLVIAALLVFFYLILGGIEWITSGGDKGKTESARNKITAAIVGLIIIASSYAILTLALRFLGFASLNEVFDSAGSIEGGAQMQPSPSPSPDTELETLLDPTPTPL